MYTKYYNKQIQLICTTTQYSSEYNIEATRIISEFIMFCMLILDIFLHTHTHTVTHNFYNLNVKRKTTQKVAEGKFYFKI